MTQSPKVRMSKAEREYWKERKAYKWYIFNTADKRILTGYEYKDDCKEYMREMNEYSTTEDLRIYSKRYLKSIGFDPDVLTNWHAGNRTAEISTMIEMQVEANK